MMVRCSRKRHAGTKYFDDPRHCRYDLEYPVLACH